MAYENIVAIDATTGERIERVLSAAEIRDRDASRQMNAQANAALQLRQQQRDQDIATVRAATRLDQVGEILARLLR